MGVAAMGTLQRRLQMQSAADFHQGQRNGEVGPCFSTLSSQA